MIKWSNLPLNRKQAHTFAAFRDELLDTGDGPGVPSPAVTWQWGDVDASHKCLSNLKENGLIESVGDRWRTSPALWAVIVDRSASRIESLAAFDGAAFSGESQHVRVR